MRVDVMEKIYTTKEIMAHEVWPKIKAVIDNAIRCYKEDYPNSKIELIDKGTCWHIVIDGVPDTEIDFLDFKAYIKDIT